MLHFLKTYWGELLFSLALAGYFASYVLAIRHQHRPGEGKQPGLPCDRC